jgi:hypothetical protein
MNTMEEAERFLEVLPGITNRLREMSPIKSYEPEPVSSSTGSRKEGEAERCRTAKE